MDEYVSNRLKFYFVTKVGSNGNTNDSVLERSDSIKHNTIRTNGVKNVPPKDFAITDLKLHVRNECGDTVEEDCSCDSQFMLTAIDRVTKNRRNDFYLIPPEQQYYLVMDNVGGYGTKQAIDEYTKLLYTKYKIIIT